MSSSTRPDLIGDLLRTACDEVLIHDLLADVERIVRSVLGPRDPDLIQTAMHDALLAVVRHRHRFRGDSLGSTWVFTIARRQALRVARGHARRRAFEVSLDGERLDRKDQARMHAILATLPEGAARIVAWEILDELVPNAAWRRIWLLHNDPRQRRTHAEIAALTGRTEGTIAVTLSRVRALLSAAVLEDVA